MPVHLPAQQGKIPGVIAETFPLFVAGIMLFIDDDDAGAGEGRKDRRAGADDDLRLVATDHPPGIEAFAVGEAGMEDGNGRA